MRGTFRLLPHSLAIVACTLVLPSWGQVKELVCYSDTFAPYVITDGGDIRGIDVDTIAEAGKRVGINVQFKTLPWVRLEREIALGAESNVDCAFAYTQTTAREAYMDFTSVPVKLTELVLFTRRGTYDAFLGFEMLKGKRIGIRRGFKIPPALSALVEQGSIKLEEVNIDLQNFEKLKLGRLDAVLSNREVGSENVRQMHAGDIVILSPPVLVTPTYLVFNKAKNLSALVPLFDKGLKSVTADGTYRKIRLRYQ
jgi:polar amino acid transport system substrate-binding protein